MSAREGAGWSCSLSEKREVFGMDRETSSLYSANNRATNFLKIFRFVRS